MCSFRSPCARGSICATATTTKGGFSAVVLKLRLPDGQIYGQDGKLDYVSPTVATNTDTITVRGVIPNPRFPDVPAELHQLRASCSTASS